MRCSRCGCAQPAPACFSNSFSTTLAKYSYCHGWSVWCSFCCKARAGLPGAQWGSYSENSSSVLWLLISSRHCTLHSLLLDVTTVQVEAAAFSGWESLHVCLFANECCCVHILGIQAYALVSSSVLCAAENTQNKWTMEEDWKIEGSYTHSRPQFHFWK